MTDRVAIITYVFPPAWAGPAERFLRYAPGLEARGMRPFFITLQTDGVTEVTSDTYRGCEVVRIPAPQWKWRLESFVARSCKWIASQPQGRRPQAAIFLNIAPLSYRSLRSLRGAGVKSIAVQTMCEAKPTLTIRGRLVGYLQRLGYSSFDHVVSSSRALQESLHLLGVEEEKISVIPNGVDQSRFRPASDDRKRETRRALQVPNDGEPVVLFVGLRNTRKGVLPLVQGWKRYKASGGKGHLLLVGEDDRRDNPELAEFFARWDREIEDAGDYEIEVRPSSQAIEQYFQACDLFVFLSELEGLPNVLPEAMASGIPIMMNKYQGFSDEIARDGIDFCVTTRDPARIARDLRTVIDSGDIRRGLRDSSLTYVSEHHSLQKSIDAYAELIKAA
jgi:glycosyltransferase involved in cell wall biosynthesis